jgi:hypothetical protein
MTLDPGHVSADPDVQDGHRDPEPANTVIEMPVSTVIEMPVSTVIEPAIRADERLRFLEAAKDFPEPHRTIIAQAAGRET